MNQPKTGSSNEYDQTTPRLFSLRDLHPPKTDAAPVSAPAPTHAVSNGVHQADATAASPLAPRFQAHTVDQNAVSSAIDEESTEQRKTRERIERHLDVSPEGRSWMESALAHRKVLVLLVIAIGAAFWTGRGDQDQIDSDPELAQTNGTLDFDPTQFDAGTLVDEGQDFFATETPNDSRSQDLLAGSNDPAIQTHAMLDQNNHPMTESLATEPVTADSSNTAALASNSLIPSKTNNTATPAATTSTGELTAGAISQLQTKASPTSGTVAAAEAAPRPEASLSQIQTGGLAVQAVSSKTPRDPIFSAPSLSNSASSAVNSAAVNGVPNQSGTELTLQSSATPTGVADWLKYLPPQQ